MLTDVFQTMVSISAKCFFFFFFLFSPLMSSFQNVVALMSLSLGKMYEGMISNISPSFFPFCFKCFLLIMYFRKDFEMLPCKTDLSEQWLADSAL